MRIVLSNWFSQGDEVQCGGGDLGQWWKGAETLEVGVIFEPYIFRLYYILEHYMSQAVLLILSHSALLYEIIKCAALLKTESLSSRKIIKRVQKKFKDISPYTP